MKPISDHEITKELKKLGEDPAFVNEMRLKHETSDKERRKWCFKLWSVVFGGFILGLSSVILTCYVVNKTDWKLGLFTFGAVVCAYYRRALEEYYEREYKQKYLNDRSKKSS